MQKMGSWPNKLFIHLLKLSVLQTLHDDACQFWNSSWPIKSCSWLLPVFIYFLHDICGQALSFTSRSLSHQTLSEFSNVMFICVLCGSCAHWLILSAPCCNCYFSRWWWANTHGPGPQSQQAALSTPELSAYCHTGRDCGSDSTQWCHLWFFAPETDCLGFAVAKHWTELNCPNWQPCISRHWCITVSSLDSVLKKI